MKEDIENSNIMELLDLGMKQHYLTHVQIRERMTPGIDEGVIVKILEDMAIKVFETPPSASELALLEYENASEILCSLDKEEPGIISHPCSFYLPEPSRETHGFFKITSGRDDIPCEMAQASSKQRT